MSPPHDLNEDALLRHLIQGTVSKRSTGYFEGPWTPSMVELAK